MPSELTPRWEGFLRDLDETAEGATDFHCIGGLS